MRLQLNMALVALLSACGGGVATSTSASVNHFTDPRVDVTTPHAQSTVTILDEVQITPTWKADVISAATPLMSAPDTVTRATEYVETRHEAGASVQWAKSRAVVGTSYTLSSEPDYTSHNVALSGSLEVLDRQGTLGLRVNAAFDQVGRSDVESFEEPLQSFGAGLSYSHIINPRLVLHGVYSIEHRRGFQSNPYRLVPVFDALAARPSLTLPERVPDLRTRHALEGLSVWSIGTTTFLHGSYRLYLDDWGILSNTLTAQLWQSLWNDKARLRLRVRGYAQEAAYFYEERYDEFPNLRSGDYRLSRMSTLSGGPRFDVRLLDLASWGGIALSASYDAMYFHLPQYAVFTSMLAHLLGLNITLEVE